LHKYAGVEGEEQNITPTVAFFIGVGFASWLSETLKMPANSLHISVNHLKQRCVAPLPETCCQQSMAFLSLQGYISACKGMPSAFQRNLACCMFPYMLQRLKLTISLKY